MVPAIRRIVPEGDIVPRGYGIAYLNWFERSAVCYPIPLNWIVGLWYIAMIPLRRGPTFFVINKIVERERRVLRAIECSHRKDVK